MSSGISHDTEEMAQNTEKTMTKYDRKVLAKQEAAKKEKRSRILSTLAVIAVIAAIIALIVGVPFYKRKQALSEYIRINDISVSQMELNYYRATVISSYSMFLPYMGLDTSIPYDQQIYNETTGMTWEDFFLDQAVYLLQRNKAMLADIKARGLSFDITEDYNAYLEEIKSAAASASISVSDYYVSLYGNYANEKTLAPFVKDYLTASAYNNYLTEELTPTAEEVQAEYDANKNDYDSVDYRVLEFATGMTDESSEEDIDAAMEKARTQAQEMLDKVNAGEDFETLCATYAPEEERTDYADSETDKSLITGASYSSSYNLYMDWLFEEGRTEGEAYVCEDEDEYTCYVVQFEKRYKADTVTDTITQTMTSDRVIDYIDGLAESFIVTDPQDNLSFID